MKWFWPEITGVRCCGSWSCGYRAIIVYFPFETISPVKTCLDRMLYRAGSEADLEGKVLTHRKVAVFYVCMRTLFIDFDITCVNNACASSANNLVAYILPALWNELFKIPHLRVCVQNLYDCRQQI